MALKKKNCTVSDSRAQYFSNLAAGSAPLGRDFIEAADISNNANWMCNSNSLVDGSGAYSAATSMQKA